MNRCVVLNGLFYSLFYCMSILGMYVIKRNISRLFHTLFLKSKLDIIEYIIRVFLISVSFFT